MLTQVELLRSYAGRNTNGDHFDAFKVNKHNKASVGPEWCAVRWEATQIESVYPIGARSPLGRWWTGADFDISYGEKCFALQMAD